MEVINKLPSNLKDYIEKRGEDLVDGYIRFLEVNEIEEISKILKNSPIWHNGIPFASTVFGDILSWEDGYIMLYKLTEEDYTVMLSGSDFFFANLEDSEYRNDFLDMELYNAAIKKYGKINHSQCYVLEPIPILGGAREEKYLNVGEFKSYIELLV